VLKNESENEDAVSNMILAFCSRGHQGVKSLVESYLIQLDLEGIGLSALQENIRDFSGLERGMVSRKSSFQRPVFISAIRTNTHSLACAGGYDGTGTK
jgi:hypothetical protein